MHTAMAGALALVAVNLNAQCTTWVNPTPTSGWVDFNNMFGGAPVASGGVCPVNEITDFEIWADEAYAMDNISQGVTYTFSVCNGTGGTAWPLSLTVVAPSGAVDAFGLDDGSICALTWTASESGSYFIVISEEGACGASSNQSVSNGFPSITCTGASAISEVASNQSFSVMPNPSTGAVTLNLEGMKMNGNSLLEVVEISGRTVLNTMVKPGTMTKELDLSALPAGTYFVTLHSNGQLVREKLVLVNN